MDTCSSKDVRKVRNREKPKTYFREGFEISRSGGVIIEEFCVGDKFSLGRYVEDCEAKLLCVSNREKLCVDDRFIIFHGRFPANVSPALTERSTTLLSRLQVPLD